MDSADQEAPRADLAQEEALVDAEGIATCTA